MKKNSILLLLALSMFANDASACSKFANEMMDGAAKLILGFGVVSVVAASFGGYKGYQSLKYRFSSIDEKIATNIELVNHRFEEIEALLQGSAMMTPERRIKLSKQLSELNMHRIKQVKISLEKNIKLADA